MKFSLARTLCILGLFSATSCAQLGGKEGGGENLPNRGITQYEPAALGEPPSAIVLAPDTNDAPKYGEPSVVVINGQVHLYVHSLNWNGEGSIWLFLSNDEGRSFQNGTLVASAPESAQGRVSAPSVSCLGQSCVLAALAGESGSIHLADGPPEGPFVWRPEPVLEATEDFETGGIGSPSVLLELDQIRLYYTARSGVDEPSVIAGGELRAGVFTRWGPLLSPSQTCTDASGNALTCWDESGIGEPEVKIARTGTGRTVYRLFFTGSNGDQKRVGFAAAWDGKTFETYAFNPVLLNGETQVSNIRVGDSYLMYYVPAATWDAGKIGLAINELGNATETF